jgi:CheY-like chemotaxis protein
MKPKKNHTMACILIVDDEDLVRRVVRQILEHAGHQIFEATNGYEALDVFGKIKPDLVITDIIMPRKEGVETIAELIQQNPRLKIIAMSGGGRTRDLNYLEIAKKLGADTVLAKPFRPHELLEAVTNTLGRAD